jgi:SAM-dependent methyltransferase
MSSCKASDTAKLISAGSYASKQLCCKDRLVAWSHGRRFRVAQQLAQSHAGGKLLDYGCGDGTFLAMVADLFSEAVGADVDPKQTADCRARFGAVPGLSFVLTEELTAARHNLAYDVVVCMEVLEHCIADKRAEVLGDLHRLVAGDGTVIISVPIEIGPSLIGKQLVRTVAGWRGLGDYRHREKFSCMEFWKMVLAGAQTSIERPVYRADFAPDRPNAFHGHKGFNWRALQARLRERFEIRQTLFSPLGWTAGYLSSQAWFVCKRS